MPDENQIEIISREMFQSLKNLKALFVNSNQLEDIQPNTFHDLASLEKLGLSEEIKFKFYF